MSWTVPSTWCLSTIGEVTEDSSQRVPADTETFAYIDIASINRDTKRIEAPQRLKGRDAPSRARKVVRAGDVLVSMTRPNLNAVAMVPAELDDQIASTGLDVLRASNVDTRWLYYLVRSADFVQAMSDLVQGALYPAIRSKDVRNFEIPVAPLAEQKRISDKLDTLLARVDACRDRLDRVPAILKRFRQSVLASAVSGRLSADWREANGLPEAKRWDNVSLPEVAEARLGKMLDKAKNQGTPTRYLRNVNVRWFGFDLNDLLEIKVSASEQNELAIKNGDVLICEGGEPGRCAVWDGGPTDLIFQKALHRVRVKPVLRPEWLCFNLKHDADSGKLEKMFTGSTIKHLTGTALAQYRFPFPSIEEQTEVVRRVTALLALADSLERRLNTTRQQAARLTPAALAKAFRGELVPQDPNDEPAAALLERIRMGSATAQAQPGTSTRGRPRKRLA